MLEAMRRGAGTKLASELHELSPEEAAVLAFLQRRLQATERKRRK
jgi:hypothetical protein